MIDVECDCLVLIKKRCFGLFWGLDIRKKNTNTVNIELNTYIPGIKKTSHELRGSILAVGCRWLTPKS